MADKGGEEDAEYNTGRAEAHGTARARLARLVGTGWTPADSGNR